MNIHPAAICALILLGFTARGDAQATVEGLVALPKSEAAAVMTKRYQVVTKAGMIATDPAVAVVYLEGVSPQPIAPLRAQMAQKELTFVTPLLPVQVGTTVEFPNLDDTYHNIFSYSKPKRFDLGRYRPDERPIPAQTFDQEGLVVLHCDIHEHMRGIILVLATPYFVLTDPDGRYRLTGLPAGHYTLKVWLDSRTTLERPVDLENGVTLHLDFP
jgi:plastocyanin